MKLPHGSEAVIDTLKVRGYCLDADHRDGKHKARVFRSALGVTHDDFQELVDVLAEAASTAEALIGKIDDYGTRYVIDFDWKRGALSTRIRSSWIIESEGDRPRFVTCFVL